MEEMLAATAQAEERHFWFRALRRNARQLLESSLHVRPRFIVDCGTGTGRNLDWLRDIGPAVGVERSPTGLSAARAHRRPVVQGSVTHLPFGDGSADVATSFDVLYCLPEADERMALAEMVRVLRPGGVALFNVAALDILHGSHSTLTMEVRRYTKARLRERLETAGLSVERMTYTNFVTFPLTVAVRYADRLRGRADTATTDDLQVPAGPINAVLNAALGLESALLRAINFPIGSSILCIARKK